MTEKIIKVDVDEAIKLAEAARAMLAALKHARRVFGDRSFQSHSENLVWIEMGDAITQAKEAGITAED